MFCRLFHVYGKHNPCFYCDWRRKGRKGWSSLIRMDHGPYSSLLHPIDRLHNTAINNPGVPPVPIYVLNYSGAVGSQSMAKLTYQLRARSLCLNFCSPPKFKTVSPSSGLPVDPGGVYKCVDKREGYLKHNNVMLIPLPAPMGHQRWS